MTQRQTPRLQQQRREASARYRLAKRTKLVDCECGTCKSCAARARQRREHASEWDESLRMPWPKIEYEPHMGSSLSDPDSGFRVARMSRAGGSE